MSEKKTKTKKAAEARGKDGRAKRQGKGLNMGFLFLVFLFLACTGVFMLVQHQFTVRSDLKRRGLESRIEDEKAKQESLRLNLARLKSPGRVARIATDELGLADPGGVIYLKYARDAAGNLVTQSTYEEMVVPEPPAAAEQESGEPVARDGDAVDGGDDHAEEETSGTGE